MRDIWGLGVESGGLYGGDLDVLFCLLRIGWVGGGGVDMSFDFVVGCSWWL